MSCSEELSSTNREASSSHPPLLPEKHRITEPVPDAGPPQLPEKTRHVTEEEIDAKLGITGRKNTSSDDKSKSEPKTHPVAALLISPTSTAVVKQVAALRATSEHPAQIQNIPYSGSEEKLTSVTELGSTSSSQSPEENLCAVCPSYPPIPAPRTRQLPSTPLPSSEDSSSKCLTNLQKQELQTVVLSCPQGSEVASKGPKPAPRIYIPENIPTAPNSCKPGKTEGTITSSGPPVTNFTLPQSRSGIGVKVAELLHKLPTGKTLPGAMPTPFLVQFPSVAKEGHKAITPDLPATVPDIGIPDVNQNPLQSEVYGDAGFDSEDCLSDGGDWCDDPEFLLPSTPIICKSIPIVPAQPHLLTQKRGYLFKYTRLCRRGSKLMDDSVQLQSGKINKLRDELQKRWQKRWVTVDENSLKYYSSSKSYVSKRIIPVCTMKNVEQDIKDISDAHPYRFRIATEHRVYYFATETVDDLSLWTSILMRAIIESKKALLLSSESSKEGGNMNSPNMMGYAKMEGSRRFLAIKQGIFCFYETESDFRHYSPIHEVALQVGSVKDIGKCKLQLNTPQVPFIFSFETQEELNSWKSAFEMGISHALGDDKVLEEVYQNQSNRYCADCGALGPEWAAINMGITICQNCAGIHRKMENAKIRSLRMDSKVWTPSLIKLMQAIGNENANKFWEWHIKEEDQIYPETDMTFRSQFIQRKYQEKQFCHLYPGESLNELLCKCVQESNDVLTTMQLVFSGADVYCISKALVEDDNKPYQLAERAKNCLQREFIFQNGGDGYHQSPSESQNLDRKD